MVIPIGCVCLLRRGNGAWSWLPVTKTRNRWAAGSWLPITKYLFRTLVLFCCVQTHEST